MSEEFYLMDEAADEYAEAHTTAAEPLLAKLERDTHVHVLNPRMISGAYQGKLLEMLSRMIRPRRILEIGTFTGYSAICLAKGLAEKGDDVSSAGCSAGRSRGRLVTIEHNPELEKRIRNYIAEAGLEDVVELRMGEAFDILTEMAAVEPLSFDLVFLDADKDRYAEYYPLLKRLMAAGGWLVIDNVLWSGKVYDPKAHDRDTAAVRALNDMIQNDPEVENLLLTVRDGLMVVRKK